MQPKSETVVSGNIFIFNNCERIVKYKAAAERVTETEQANYADSRQTDSLMLFSVRMGIFIHIGSKRARCQMRRRFQTVSIVPVLFNCPSFITTFPRITLFKIKTIVTRSSVGAMVDIDESVVFGCAVIGGIVVARFLYSVAVFLFSTFLGSGVNVKKLGSWAVVTVNICNEIYL